MRKPNTEEVKKTAEGVWADFKKFAFKGNMVDMAVAVIVGGAFGKIVSSLVSDMIMPLIGMLLGNINLTDLKFTVPHPDGMTGATLNYGMFLQNVLDFLIISFTIFIVLRLYTKIMRKHEELPELSTQEELLTEIRDLLKEADKK